MTKSNDIAIAVTTLGTGAPVLDPNRFSQSILVEAAGHQLLFDTGRGAVLRLVQAGVKPASVGQLFFTHYHSDHTVGFLADHFFFSSLLLPSSAYCHRHLRAQRAHLPTYGAIVVDGARPDE